MSTLAKNGWVSTGDDSLITVDVYAGAKEVIVNSLQEATKTTSNKFTQALQGGKVAADRIGTVIPKSLTEQVFKSDQLMSQVTAFAPGVTASMNGLGASIQSSILKEVQKKTQTLVDVGGVVQKVKNANVSDILNLGGVVSNFTGVKDVVKVLDVGGQAGFVSGVVNECTKRGVPSVLDQMLDKVTDNKVVKQVLGKVLPTVIQAGETKLLGKIAEKMGPNATRILNPSVIKDFSKGYGFGYKQPTNIKSILFNEVKTAFGKVDQNWTSKTRRLSTGSNDNCVNLSEILHGSVDFKSIVTAGAKKALEPVDRWLGFGSKMRPGNVMSAIPNCFPGMSVKPNTDDRKRIQPPTILWT